MFIVEEFESENRIVRGKNSGKIIFVIVSKISK